MKRTRPDGSVCDLLAEAAASCDHPASGGSSSGDQPLSPERSEDNRAAEMQRVGSLKVTIQRSSESREFGQTDRTAEGQTGGLHCHVCDHACRSVQAFHEHISGAEHAKKLRAMTNSICLRTHTLPERKLQPRTKRWCETCQSHFTGDVIAHRRTNQHKMCKQLCRPFCPVCKLHFRTPRKFVEHMKSSDHKQKVQENQEEELITVDAVGCFKDEEDKEEEEEEEEEEAAEVVGDDDDGKVSETQNKVLQRDDAEDYDQNTTYGSSFVVPVSGFQCRLCNKFFHKEATARHTHCRTRTHYLNLQRHKAQRAQEERGDNSPPAPT
ncbi:cdkn1a interacting zinc finger protein 1b [Cynoglossus semilaevis]|uniref:Cip1-interacting zinc finger protein-like n=1 Tax=Cynoglossus semilaevis TaxID=244447 RepID=A0A3P8VH11_CYNSE|nr:cip1-interacting zinc finger protein-like [Cynoglossus semilaevis]XP_016898476.1 cip1-interacting zinc finger protein-like [Cynoglossus semilaevis]